MYFRPTGLWLGMAVWVVVAAVSGVARAQHITVDGSFSATQTLVGPNYNIGANLGKQVGGNLFHSFGVFGLSQGESANFSGPATVANVIGRVTGGTASSINGAINSSIAGANLYMINPSGIVFGPNATVNVLGSFRAATADYLKLSDGARFQATNPSGSTLSAAAPAAFGFLTAAPAAITVNGSQLAVPTGKTLGIAGGPVTISGANLTAPSGTIRVTSVASPGEIPAAPNTGQNPTITARGTVSISGGATLNVNNPTGLGSGGSVFIHAGALTISASEIDGDNRGPGPGGTIVLQADNQLALSSAATIHAVALASGRGGDVTVSAGQLTMTSGALLESGTTGAGGGGNIAISVTGPMMIDGPGASITTSTAAGSTAPAGQVTVTAGSLSITNNGSIQSSTSGSGNAGNISLRAGTLALASFGGIFSNSHSSGPAGDIAVTVTGAGPEAVTILPNGFIAANAFSTGNGGQIAVTVAGGLTVNGTTANNSSATGIVANAEPGSSGNAGAVKVTAGSITILANGEISSGTITGTPDATGNGGNVVVNVSGLLTIDGTGEAISTGISAQTEGTGNAGTVMIAAGNMSIASNGVISGGSIGATATGNGGNVIVNVAGLLSIEGARGNPGLLTGITSQSQGSGNAGTVTVNAGELSIAEDGAISGKTFGLGAGGDVNVDAALITLSGAGPQITARSTGTGIAGDVMVSAGTLQILDGASISAAGAQAKGGNISLSAGDLLYLKQGSITTSSAGVKSDGGNITIVPRFAVLDQSTITANAFGGNGGNISISATLFILSSDSAVTASSQTGIAGTITISGQESALNSSLVVLPSTLREVAAILRDACAARAGRPHSTLTQGGRGGLPQDSEARIPALYLAGRDSDLASFATASAVPMITRHTSLHLTMPCGAIDAGKSFAPPSSERP